MSRRLLDRLYQLSGLTGAVMLVLILLMVITQMIARWIEVPVTGLTEIAGYFMAATSFFGLGYALSREAHIRVNLIIGPPGSGGRFPEIVCTAIGTVLAGAFAWYAVKTTVLSYRFAEVSQGQDEVPTWIPQLAMSVGTLVFLVAMLDRLVGLAAGWSKHPDPGVSGPMARGE